MADGLLRLLEHLAHLERDRFKICRQPSVLVLGKRSEKRVHQDLFRCREENRPDGRGKGLPVTWAECRARFALSQYSAFVWHALRPTAAISCAA